MALTLPTNVYLNPTLKLRSTVMGNYAILVNSPSRALAVDANLNVRVLTPDPPVGPMTLSGVSGGVLSGTFAARQTYVIFDAFGNLISESDFGPTATATTIASQALQAANVNLSPDTVSARRLYRTTNGTAVYFQWIDVDGNAVTTMQDDLSDAGLATFSAPSLGTPPNLYVISEFKSRLFGVSKAIPNTLVYSEVARAYAWPGANLIQIPRVGSDNRGVTGLVRRRDALGVARANGFYQLTGTSDTDFRLVNLSENCGIEATDSVAVYRDVAYFLWKDGVYCWDVSGLRCISDGQIRRWFTSNGTFNISRLQYAFGIIDPLRFKYRLYLASAGSSTEDCWIEYDFISKTWWGPHLSHAMNPSSAFILSTDSGATIPLVGGTDGYCRLDRLNRTDDTNVGIDYDVVTARDTAGTPDHEKYFGELSVSMKPQPRGSLIIQTTVGELDQPRSQVDVDQTLHADLTQSRQRLGRVGQGKAFKLRFRNAEPGVDVNLRGYEIDPVTVIGKR